MRTKGLLKKKDEDKIVISLMPQNDCYFIDASKWESYSVYIENLTPDKTDMKSKNFISQLKNNWGINLDDHGFEPQQ